MQAVTAILILGAIASLVAWVILLLLEHGIRPVHSMVHFVRRLPWSGRLAVLPLFIALVVYGSVKNHSNERGEMSNEIGSESGFNRVDRVEGDESGFNAETQSSGDAQSGDLDNVANVEMLPIANTNSQLEIGNTGNSQLQTLNSQLTQADCEAGFVLSGVGYGEEFDFAPPNDAVVCDDWLRFGAHEDWIYIGPGAWSSRFGSNFVETVRVFSCGGIDFFPEGHISLLNNPISIAPAANWHLLSVSNSMFWHAETPSNTLVLTWQNALLNRRADSPVNIQAELFPSGGMRITHNLSGETVAVTECLPAPQLPLHVSLDEVKGRFADGNTNAYYYADVVVEKGPSIVTVRCDAETALGDYAVAAYPGETNRLPFLIGPQYEVESEAAFAHFGVADCEVIKTNFTDRIVGLQWPVEISFEEGYAGSGKMFEMSVVPNFLKGSVFVGDGRGRSRAAGCPCGCDVDTNGVVRISEACNCDPCTISGSYGYEGYSEEFEFNYYPEEDGEDWDPDNPEDPGEPPEESKPSATIWFDKSAVIFEDEYENEPGVVVPRRSTRVKLTCCAYGGELGGNFTVDLSGMGALKLVSGTPPSSRTLAPYETVTFEAEYEAEKASSHEKGTVARAKITENETNQVFDDDDKITVVEVLVDSMAIKPLDCRNRHIYGICEKVQISWRPVAFNLDWDNNGKGRWLSNNVGYREFQCEDCACEMSLKANVSGVSYDVVLSCIEPSGIECSVVSEFISKLQLGYGDAGDVGMNLIFTVSPKTVSFNNIRFKEVPSTVGVHTGYFGMSDWKDCWYHSPENGADVVVVLNEDNDGVDDAYIGFCSSPWTSGLMTWEIPAVWQPPIDSGSSKSAVQFAQYVQRFQINANGTVTVSKFGHVAERGTNTVKKIDGVIVE